jgi:hypothetical protein
MNPPFHACCLYYNKWWKINKENSGKLEDLNKNLRCWQLKAGMVLRSSGDGSGETLLFENRFSENRPGESENRRQGVKTDV